VHASGSIYALSSEVIGALAAAKNDRLADQIVEPL
jgi:hypothetical protein